MASLHSQTIPPSSSTVSVSIIDTTASIRNVRTDDYLTPVISGHDYLAVPCFSFYIHHPASNQSLLFDLGIRRDFGNLAPSYIAGISHLGFRIVVERDVRQILEEANMDPNSIDAIIWSHWHFDHTGDPSRFGPNTAIVVGPGFKDEHLPGYPANPKGYVLESDYADREVLELDFEGPNIVSIGQFKAVDYFEDGSFYILDAPGHATGHLCGLARVTSNPDSFILMGADAGHHPGMIRPNEHRPLPENLVPHPFEPSKGGFCPGGVFMPLLRRGEEDAKRARPIYDPSPKAHQDVDQSIKTITKIQELDAREDLFVVLAHDESLMDVVDFFPLTANEFAQKGWAQQSRWMFLKDFASAVGWDGEVENQRSWGQE